MFRLRADLLAVAGPGSSTGCTRFCSPSWTGPEPASMVPTSARKRGSRHRSVAGRPAEDRQQTPPDLRRKRHSARHPEPRPCRRHPDRRRPAGPTPLTPRSLTRRQGRRLRPQPPRTALAPDSSGHIPQRRPENRRALGNYVTSLNRPWPCSTGSKTSPSAGNDAPNSTLPSSPSPAASSAGDVSRRPERDCVTSSKKLYILRCNSRSRRMRR